MTIMATDSPDARDTEPDDQKPKGKKRGSRERELELELELERLKRATREPDREPDAEPEPAPGAVPPVRARRWPLLVALVAAGALLLTSVLFFVNWRSDHGEAGTQRSRSDAAGVAAQFVQGLLSFDYQKPDANKDAILPISTPEFGSKLQTELLPQVTKAFGEVQGSSTATVTERFTSDVDGSTVKVIVAADLQTSVSGGASRTVPGLVFLVSLKHSGGRWLVDDASQLTTSAQAPTTAAPAPAPTGTDAPTPGG